MAVPALFQLRPGQNQALAIVSVKVGNDFLFDLMRDVLADLKSDDPILSLLPVQRPSSNTKTTQHTRESVLNNKGSG